MTDDFANLHPLHYWKPTHTVTHSKRRCSYARRAQFVSYYWSIEIVLPLRVRLELRAKAMQSKLQ
jgi:hypothetical protein